MKIIIFKCGWRKLATDNYVKDCIVPIHSHPPCGVPHIYDSGDSLNTWRWWDPINISYRHASSEKEARELTKISLAKRPDIYVL